jgi:Bacterial TSP3 repeat
MVRRLARGIVFFFFLSITHCVGVLKDSNNGGSPAYALWLALLTPANGELLPPVNVSLPPAVSINGIESGAIQVAPSDISAPPAIDGRFVPIGAVYDITLNLDPQGQIDAATLAEAQTVFEGVTAELTYAYDSDALTAAGFLPEFQAYYWDQLAQKWLPAEAATADEARGVVVVRTQHFTPFVLTALPASSGVAPDPPACLAADFPGGPGGTGSAVFSLVDANFRYYRDRPLYTIQDTPTFQALGFRNSLGISTCNGGVAPCTGNPDHKFYAGLNYITFVAHTNIDVYVMYDSRGAGNGTSANDATWLKGPGWIETGDYIHTTDPVSVLPNRGYRVYRRSYSAGETVALHGNRNGTADAAIQTNYWVVIKRQGVTTNEPAAALCVASPDQSAPGPITNLQAVAGPTSVILTWENPADPDLTNVLIRRSATSPPASLSEGQAPGGAAISAQSYTDVGLTPAATYYYTLFTLDANLNFQAGASVSVTTQAAGTDGDGDGLPDAYEDATDYSAIFGGAARASSKLQADSDGDGTLDGAEVALGTDPTNPDAIQPTITQWLLSSGTPTTNGEVAWTLDATDNVGVVGWMTTLHNRPPSANDSRWGPTKPLRYELYATGVYDFYAWAKDAAGNVNPIVTPLNVNLAGINLPRNLYASFEYGTLLNYAINRTNGQLTLRQNADVRQGSTGLGLYALDISRDGASLISALTTPLNTGGSRIRIDSLDPLNGDFAVANVANYATIKMHWIAFHPALDRIYAMVQPNPMGCPGAYYQYGWNGAARTVSYSTQAPALTCFPKRSIVHPSGSFRPGWAKRRFVSH